MISKKEVKRMRVSRTKDDCEKRGGEDEGFTGVTVKKEAIL